MIGKLTLSGLTLAVLSVLVLIDARPAHAQTETVLYNFAGGSDGAVPFSRLASDGAGNFYGTTYFGGAFGAGTVFELSPDGHGGWYEKVLYSFDGGTHGGNPWLSYVIFDKAGNLYGTACTGGANGHGVVFELSPVGKRWKETVLHSFTDTMDDALPVNGLIMDAAGNLYGATFYGAVFELSPSGGHWTEQVIYDFATNLHAGLTMDAAGNIFGATFRYVFELSPNGGGVWNPDVIYNFTGPPKDGSNPDDTLVLDQAGSLYGTTTAGGASNNGTVFKMSHGKNGWTERILYSFKGVRKNDGSGPFAGIVFDAKGNIYGATQSGGKHGDGTVFELAAPVGKGKYVEKVLWSFSGADGHAPFADLILDSAGNLYGTTTAGGSSNNGVVFEVTP